MLDDLAVDESSAAPPPIERVLDEQIAYYRARAGEYDEWFLRRGRYDHGPAFNARWFAEADEVRQALARFDPRGAVLELAGGTGIWTERLLRTADHITVVDSSPEVLAINRARVGAERAAFVEADLFTWAPDRRYDVVFFSFWLSHVPPERFAEFWRRVGEWLAPGGRAFFVDSLYTPTTTAADHRLEGEDATTMTRRLNDGREFRIVKVFYRPEALQAQLASHGWTAEVNATASYFLFGSASPPQGAPSPR